MSGLEDWLRWTADRNDLSAAAHRTVQAMIEDPEAAAFASARELAGKAGVNVATVTRAAQALGFQGWPQLQLEIRSRYLKGLSASDVARVHRRDQIAVAPSELSIGRSLENIRAVQRVLDRKLLHRIAGDIARARQTVIVAPGSFGGIGLPLAHNIRLAGYPVQLLSDDAALAGALPSLSSGDVLFAISFWRLYRTTVEAATAARRQGCCVIALSDSVNNALTRQATHKVVVPSQSASHFPSLVAGQAAAEAILADLATIDPDRSRTALARAEAAWDTLDVLHPNAP
ncbi:MAG: MurR/RpiR family transcriptional regulator [Pseudodonghicola sp.]